MRTVVSDTSCVIDLRKAALLEALLRLPYMFVIPDTLLEDEWLCLTEAEKQSLRDLSLRAPDMCGRTRWDATASSLDPRRWDCEAGWCVWRTAALILHNQSTNASHKLLYSLHLQDIVGAQSCKTSLRSAQSGPMSLAPQAAPRQGL